MLMTPLSVTSFELSLQSSRNIFHIFSQTSAFRCLHSTSVTMFQTEPFINAHVASSAGKTLPSLMLIIEVNDTIQSTKLQIWKLSQHIFFLPLSTNKPVYTSDWLCTVNTSQTHFHLSILSLRLWAQTFKTEKW